MTENKAIRLKIYFERDNDIERVVDIDSESTLEDLHLTILAAFEFSAGEMASFWLCNNLWEREQEVPMIRIKDEETEEECASMSDVQTIAAINKERGFLIYEYDMLLMWVLRIEYVEIVNQIEGMQYPVLVADKGIVPNADEARGKLLMNSTEEEAESSDMFKEGGGVDDYDIDDIESEYSDY